MSTNIIRIADVRPQPSAMTEGLMELSRLATQVATESGDEMVAAAVLLANTLKNGKKVLACGNGGSAADAQHFVAELVGRLINDRRALPAISLTVDPSIMTAVANDYGYDQVFARQVEALGVQGDLLIVISTSGKSPNIVQAVDTAHQNGLRTLAFVGETVSEEMGKCDVCISIPSGKTMRIQALHMAILHLICQNAEQQLGLAA